MKHHTKFRLRRGVAAALLLTLLLAGCEASPPALTTPATTPPAPLPTETHEPTAPATTEPVTEPTTEPTDEPTTAPTEEAVALPSLPEQLLAAMTLEEKVCQLFVTTPDQLTQVSGATVAGEATKAALAAWPVGGLIYFSENLLSADQISAMIAGSQQYSKIPLLICVDEEGGRVSRLSDIGATDAFSPMAEYGSAGDASAVREIGVTLGRQLRDLGFNVDFAPVADVLTNPNNREIGDRAFSDDPEVAAVMVAAMVEGLRSQGTISCLKHFPGHGSTEADSHTGLSLTPRTLEELRSAELLPFRAGIDAGAEMVMISHMSAPNITGDETPCDLSETVVTGLLRNELGFSGVVITDAHNMGAITTLYTCGEAAVQAIAAGCDIVLMPADLPAAVEAVLTAVDNGTLSEARIDQSVLRILNLKYSSGILQYLPDSAF